VPVPPLPDFSQFGPIDRQPLGKIARTAATNLSVAWQVIPHVTQHDLADITELEAARRRYAQAQPPDAPKITLTVVVMKAVVAALKAFPHFNASLDTRTNELVLKRYYHIGCAVDTPHGLLVPVVRDVDQKSLRQIAAELTELAERARQRKLDLKDMQGASFTITNLGGIAGTAFTPIVNYPEVAILGISRTRPELRLGENGQPQERLMLPLSLSYDHRVINGADGARFLAKVCGDLSDVFRLVVEG
ncbi:MAG: pyruvate dehydrogenase, partial [Planctomycetes bacterium]|nr:pyruvate dehydrogenase [Planctomycetota bacterium]